MKAIIFGAGGQDGFYLRQLCLAQGVEPISVSRSSGDVRLDVAQFSPICDLIKVSQPDLIFQLAAHSTTRHDALFDNHAAIATGTLNVLEAAWKYAPHAKVFVAGSGVQFVNTGRPISEQDPFDASSPYAVARIQATFAARYYRHLGLRAYVGFLFHHESPHRKQTHVSKLVALAARKTHDGEQAILQIGNLSVEKEWTFAGDVAAAMLALLNQTDVFEAVIGSGIVHSIREWVERCFGFWGLEWSRYVREAEGFTPEYPRLQSNPAKIMALGWQPRVGFDELVRLMAEG